MLKLLDFFQPLNFVTLSYFLTLFLFFDLLGTFIKDRVFHLEDGTNSRIINWTFGLAFFVFLWFLLSLFLTPGRSQILISIGLLTILTLPFYLKTGSYMGLFKELWNLKVPILIISLFLPAVFVRASLPPYYSDEIAYHFISPDALNVLAPIRYGGGFFASLPRILDLFWRLVFTLFHTYSVARLFHFTILATSMVYSYSVLKKNFGLLPAFLFVLVFFSLPQNIVFTSTLGFIDVGAYSFLLMGVISSIDFFMNKQQSSLILAFSFWAMNLGTKYTGISSFISFLLVSVVCVIYGWSEFSKVFSRKLLLKIFIVFTILGGYWYLKNLIVYGNPIYPFLLPCWGSYYPTCPATSSFFGSWTTKINLVNARYILDQLFPKHMLLQILVVAAPVLALFGSSKKLRFVALYPFLMVLIELFILKYFSGFTIRYQQHLQLYLLLGLVIALSGKYKNHFIQICVKLGLLGLFATSTFLIIYTLKFTFSNSLEWAEIKYSTGRMNIYDWVDYYFPRMKYITRWCESPPGGKRTPLAIFEPDLIWDNRIYEDGYYLHSFATNCYISNPSLRGTPIAGTVQYLKGTKAKFWIASMNDCVPSKNLVPIYPDESESDLSQRRLNNAIICNSTKVGLHLYYFDYTKVK